MTASLLKPEKVVLRGRDVTRSKVYQNHRCLRFKTALPTKVSGPAGMSFLTQAAGNVKILTRFGKNHMLKFVSASLLFGSWQVMQKYGPEDRSVPIM